MNTLALAFGIGTQELIVIALIIIVLFGATKLPKLGSSIGEGIRNFKRGMREVEAEEAEAKKEKEKQALTEEKQALTEEKPNITEEKPS